MAASASCIVVIRVPILHRCAVRLRSYKASWIHSHLSGRHPDSDAGALDLWPPARYKRAAGLLSL